MALSPDTLIIRLINVEPWTLLFWRGLLTAVGIGILALIFHRRATARAFRRVGRSGLMLALIFTGSTLSFINALHYTSVANTLVIVSAAPVFAALLSRVFLAERVSRHTWITMAVVIGAVGLTVSGSFGGGSWIGDLCALATSICVASTFVISRHARARDMTPAMALSGLLTALAALPLAAPATVDARAMALLIMLGLLLTVAFALLIVGPRYVSAPEVSLLMPLETVLGTGLVWVLLGEQPSVQSILGGFIIIAALSVHSSIALRQAES